MKSRICIIIFIIVSGYVISNTSKDWNGWVFTWDKSGYHLHLPAMFIYHDVTQLEFYSYIDDVHHPTGEHRNYCLEKLDNGNRANRYSIGVAVHELPFFLVAHFINTTYLDYAADGYSTPYQWGAVISNLFWIALGLFIIRKLLLRYFSDNVTAVTLAAIAFGTNLYYYTVFNHGMAHGYSFFDFALVMLFTDNLYKRKSVTAFYMLGLSLGLVTITRSPNLLVVLIPLLWGVNSKAAIRERLQFFRSNIVHITIGAICFLAIVMLQLGYWKFITGHWLYDGYANEGFLWTEPMIRRGLIGFQKGWFVYTPMALFAVWGIYSMRKRFAEHIPAIVIYMVINIYVIFSWWNWWYGGGLGCRPLVEAMAVLSLPLAAFTEQVVNSKKFIAISYGVVITLFISLNLFQSYQLFKNLIDSEYMTRAYYFRSFLKLKVTEDDRKLLPTPYEKYLISGPRIQAVQNKKK